MGFIPMLKFAGRSGGGSTPTLDGNAQAGDVASPKTFYNTDATSQVTGSMDSFQSTTYMSPGDIAAFANAGYHGDGDVIIGRPLSQFTPGSASACNIEEGYDLWVNGKHIEGTYDGSDKIDVSGSNFDTTKVSMPTNVFSINSSDEMEENTFVVNNSNATVKECTPLEIHRNGMRYWRKGIVDGTLVADSSHKIYIPRGSMYLMNMLAYNHTTGKNIGSRTYTITTNGGAASTSALAVPKLQSLTNLSEPCKITLGADTSGPNFLYTGGATYAGYIIIGSCGTACRLEYEITPLLTPVNNFLY